MDIKLSDIDFTNKYNIFPFKTKDEYVNALFDNYSKRNNNPVTLNNSGKDEDLLFYYNQVEAVSEHKDKDGNHTIQLYVIRDNRMQPIEMKVFSQ